MKHIRQYYSLLYIDFKELYSGINLLDLTIMLSVFFHQINTGGNNKDNFFKLFHFVAQENYLNDSNNIYINKFRLFKWK